MIPAIPAFRSRVQRPESTESTRDHQAAAYLWVPIFETLVAGHRTLDFLALWRIAPILMHTLHRNNAIRIGAKRNCSNQPSQHGFEPRLDGKVDTEMIVGVPAEVKDCESRVSTTPGGVAELVARGHRVLVEAGAGEGSGFSDNAY